MAWAVFRVSAVVRAAKQISATTGASAQSAFLNAPMYGLSVSSALFSNPAIPGDITELFALSGSGIGGGSLRESFFGSGIFLGLRVRRNRELPPVGWNARTRLGRQEQMFGRQ